MVWIILAGALQVLLCIVPSTPTSMRNSLKINPKVCSVDNVEGRCMFVWECINTEGRHLGMCVDTFMFGSCCSHNPNKGSTSTAVSEKTSPTLLYTKPSKSPTPYTTHKTSPTTAYTTHKTSPTTAYTTHKNYPTTPVSTQKPSSPTLLTKPTPPTSILYSKPIRQTQRPMLSYYSHKDISSVIANVTQRPYNMKPHKESLGRPVNVYNNNEKIDDFSTETVNRYPSTESNRYQLFSSSNTNVYTSWTKPPSSSSSHPSAPSSSFTLRPSIYYTSKPSSSSSSSHYLDNWSSDSNNEVDSHMETSWSQKPTWHVTSPLPFVTRPRPSSNLKPNKHIKKPWQTTTTPSTTTTTTTTTRPPPSSSPPDLVTMVSASLPLHLASPSTTTMATTLRPNLTVSASSQRDIPCGRSPLVHRHEVRIVGGQNAQFGEWPWQVSVRRTSFFGFSSTHRCGGALLNPNWIATAGHCVDDLLTSQIKIRVGEFDFSKLDEPFPYQERGVAQKTVHPRYNFFTYEYDLALARLESPVELAPNIVPICLPGSDDLLIGENATVTGWGRLSEGGSLPPVLQKVTVPIVSNEKCRSMFLRAGRYEFISDIFMCAGFDNGGRDSCQGDSGGPLQVKGKDGRYFLAGIISWGIGCAEANLPGVCTRISKFVPWILDTVT